MHLKFLWFFTWISYLILLLPLSAFKFPISKDPNDVKFYLFANSSNLADWTEIDQPEKLNFQYHPNRPWIFMVHGFNHIVIDPLKFGIAVLKDAYLQNSSYNVVIVDWRKLSSSEPALSNGIGTAVLYPIGQSYVRIAGEKIANFIIEMYKSNVIQDYKDVHLIGHSLGAHVVGAAGHYVTKGTFGNEMIGGITGLDPSKIFFYGIPKNYRLGPDQALFVDVIHSAITSLGTSVPVGHVDYYPNGGHTLRQRYTKNECELDRVVCGHLSSIFYFESILKGQKYVSCLCGNGNKSAEVSTQYRRTRCSKPKSLCSGPNFGEVLPKKYYGQYYTFV